MQVHKYTEMSKKVLDLYSYKYYNWGMNKFTFRYIIVHKQVLAGEKSKERCRYEYKLFLTKQL